MARRVIGQCAAVAAGVCLLGGGVARGAVVRVATFEDLAPGAYGSSFTDPASGVRFRTTPGRSLAVARSSTSFGGGKYLTEGTYGEGGLGTGVVFFGDLPEPASMVSVDVFHLGNQQGLHLRGFDARGAMVAEAYQGPGVRWYTIAISTPGNDITTFHVLPWDLGGQAYNNVSFTVPEPTGAMGAAAGFVGAAGWLGRRGRKGGGPCGG